MQQTDIALRTLKQLKQLGVSIAIDDFGTGYSSLAVPAALPGRQAEDRPQLRRRACPATSDQARDRLRDRRAGARARLKVVAEGVETEAQREFLRACGCDFIQGYLIGRPVDAETAAKDYV